MQTAEELRKGEDKPADKSLFCSIELTRHGFVVAVYSGASNDEEEAAIRKALAPILPKRASPGFWDRLRRVA
jgi:hypothetical protein